MSENCTEIRIGRTAENEARVVRFNVSDWQGIYGPGGAFILMHQRPNEDEPYICQASVAEDGWLEWVVKAPDLQRTGRGQLQLSYVVDEQIAKSTIFTTRISRSLDQNDELPEPYENMIEELIQAAADIVIVGQQVQTAKEAADADVLKAEGHAIGKQNGEDVQSDSPYYHNNAKYYSEQAGASATAAGLSAQQAGSSAGAAASDALKAEGHAIGKQNGENVLSDSPYYHNNAKYYSEQAGASATAAGLSAQQAGNRAGAAAADALKAEGYAVGKQNGEDVPSDSPYYHNSAEYYKDQAAGEAERAEAAAEDAEEYAEDAAPAIINSASGSIASFSDGADNRKIRSLVVNIDPVQDLHGQDAPYPAGGGTQLFNPNTINEGKGLDGSGQLVNSSVNNTSDYIPVLPNTKYTISQDAFSGTKTVAFYLSDKTYLSGGSNYTETPYTFTTTAICAYVRFSYAQENTSSLLFNKGEYSNICPITGWTGCEVNVTGNNLFDSELLLEASGWSESDGKYTGSTGQLGTKYGGNTKGFFPDYPFKANTQYTLAFKSSVDGENIGNGRFVIEYTDGSTITQVYITKVETSVTGTSTVNKTIKRIYFDYGGGRTLTLWDVILCEGAEAKPYEPFGTTISIVFKDENDNTLTVYGGKDEIIGGALAVNRVGEYVNPNSVTYFDNNSGFSRFKFFASNIPNIPTNISKWLSNAFKIYPKSSIPQRPYSFMRENNGNNSNIWVFLPSVYNTTELGRQYFTNNQVFIVYELAAELRYTITKRDIKTMLKDNNIWANTGDIDSVDYVADTKLYIDNKITQMIASALNA